MVECEEHLVQLERGPAAAGSNLESEASTDSVSNYRYSLDKPASSHLDSESSTITDAVSNKDAGDVGADMAPADCHGGTTLQGLSNRHQQRAEPAARKVGVGLKCDRRDDGRFVVAALQPGGAAARCGMIETGDQVRAVSGVDLTGKAKADLRDMIMGPPGSHVRLDLTRADDSVQQVTLVREAAAADEHAASSPPAPAAATVSAHRAKLGHLGMRLERTDGGLLRVCEVDEGGGAAMRDICPGDIISDIDGVRVVHLDQPTINGLLCGVPGTIVAVTVRGRDGCERAVQAVRTPANEGQGMDPEQSFDVRSENGEEDVDNRSRGRKTGLGMSFKNNHTGMIVVRRVKECGPAERVGIVEGDIIVALDGHQLQNMYSDKKQLSRLMLGHPGSEVKVTLQRKGQTKIEQVLLQRGDGQQSASSQRMMGVGAEGCVAPQESWMSDQGASADVKLGLGLTFVKPDGQPGVVVKRVKEGGGAAACGKIFPGDRVMRIDDHDLVQVNSKLLSSLVMGFEGSVARLRIQRLGGAVEELAVVRGDQELQDHHHQMKVAAGLSAESSIDFSVSGEPRPHRDRCGLGLTFKPPDGAPGMVISRIKDNGPAASSTLERGDRLIEVDGISLPSKQSQSSWSALTSVVMGPEGSRARLQVRKQDGRSVSIVIIRGQVGGDGGLRLDAERSRESMASTADSDAASASDMSEAASDMSAMTYVNDDSGLVGIGITFHRPDGQGGVQVKRVKEGSAAAEDGRIVAGCRLLAIDGAVLGAQIVHKDLAAMVLGEAGTSVSLRVQTQAGELNEIVLRRRRSPTSPVKGVRTSDSCGLGITFFPRADDDDSVVIKRLKAGGAAQRSQRIVPYDCLLAIDGHQVNHRLSASELKALLLGAPGSDCAVRIRHRNGREETVTLVRTSDRPPPQDPAGADGVRVIAAEQSLDERGTMGMLWNEGHPAIIAGEQSLDEIGLMAAAARVERKRKAGLGMVLNEDDGGEGLVIRHIKPGTAAGAASSAVHAGDKLLSIDGVPLSGLGRRDVEKLVMQPEGSASLCVLRRGRDASLDHVLLVRPSGDHVRAEQPGQEHQQVTQDRHRQQTPGQWKRVVEEEEERQQQEQQCHSEVSWHTAPHVQAEDGENGEGNAVGLGMVFLRADDKGGRVIKRIKEGSAADADGHVVPGDRCLAIDGQSVEGMTDRELSDVNKGSIGSVAAVVVRSRGGIVKEFSLKRRRPVLEDILEGCGSELSCNSSIASGLTASGSLSGKSGLGLTFHEWDSRANAGLRVKRVKPGGAAAACGLIEYGDVVTSIDGVSVDKIEHRCVCVCVGVCVGVCLCACVHVCVHVCVHILCAQ